MVGKRGWLRIAEACIAILIVMAMLLLMARTKSVEGQDFTSNLPAILDEISRTESFREKIVKDDPSIKAELERFVKARLPQIGADFALLICKTTDPCKLESVPAKDVYASERFIGGSLTTSPHSETKRIRLFVWR
ncbi:hypothetical protein FJZ18_04455 [Candidatus Pacearchaeota archaeon]|nr:hypothetical protein [Candidatus Pacearchaeota archaeon]